MRDIPFGKATKIHPYAWLWEPLENDPGFLLRSMFGGKSAYIDGKLALFFDAFAKSDPRRGVGVCTSQEHHASLQKEFPALVTHEILPKWLYLSESHDRFESVAGKLVALAKRRDPRIGVVGKPRKARKARKKK